MNSKLEITFHMRVGSIKQYLQKAAPYTYEGPNGPKTIRLRLGELAGINIQLQAFRMI